MSRAPRGPSALASLPVSVWVWSGLAVAFVGFALFWAPQLLVLRALGLDPGRRRAARFAASGLRAFLAWNAGFVGRPRLRGLEGLAGRGPFVVVANHESYLDSALLLALLPFPVRLVSRAEIRAIPVLGFAAEVAGVLFASRGESEESEPGEILGRAQEALREGVSVAFFPEGTRSRGRGIQRFRRGAFEVAKAAGVPVLPVVLSGTGEFMPPGTWRLGRLRVAVEALEPRIVEDAEARKGLREDMAGVQARLCD